MTDLNLLKRVFINILSVVDTDFIIENYPEPSLDEDMPTQVSPSCCYMFGQSPRGAITGQGTAALKFKARPGDVAAFMCTSIYADSSSAALIYGLKYASGDSLFTGFIPEVVTRTGAVSPDTDTPNGLPAIHSALNFASWNTFVKKAGTEKMQVCFALYALAGDGNTQNLWGYYCWDASIMITKTK